MKNFYFKITALIVGTFLLGIAFIFAQDDPFSRLSYPIPELDNCKNREACEAYCEKPENMETCLDFASVNNLLAVEEIAMARRMLKAGEITGPGGCKSQEACEVYCDNIDHLEECISFAEEHNLIPQEELAEARKVIAAIKKGLKPPPCKGKKECDAYCSRSENMEKCLEFGEAAGLIPPNELTEAKKVLTAIKKGAKPPGCSGKEGCDVYCSQPEHMEECMEFGLAAGLIPPEETENARRTLEALKKGIRPPNCRGKEECDVYCSQAEHMEECMEFGLAAGFIPLEDIESAKKTLQALKKGIKPPNCRGKEECDVYCSEIEHMEECMEFGLAAGFIPPEEAENARRTLEALKKGVNPPNCRGEEECAVYCSEPEHREECINFAEAAGFMSPEEEQRARESGGAGPGGCRSQEECEVYCQVAEHRQECIDFAEKRGEMTPEEAERSRQNIKFQEQGGPGGCRNADECEAYCNQGPNQMRECIEFGVRFGQFAPEQAQEMLQQLKTREQIEMTSPQPQEPPQEQSPQDEMAPQIEEGVPQLLEERIAPPPAEIIPPPAEMAPPAEGTEPPDSPQSLLESFKPFLAALSAAFGF